MRCINVIVFCLFFIASIRAQISNVEYFGGNVDLDVSDVTQVLRYEDDIICIGIVDAGTVSESYVIFRSDVRGNVLWSTYTEINFEDVGTYELEMFLSVDGSLYTYVPRFNTNGIGADNYIYKINPIDGAVEYQVAQDIELLKDYNSDYLVGITGYRRILMNRITGVIEEEDVVFSQNVDNVSADNSGNIYLTGSSLIQKYNLADTKIALWELLINDSEEINEVYIDDYDELYLFLKNENDQSVITKLDKETGEIFWSVIASNSFQDVRLSDYIDDGEFIYASFRHVFVGSVNPFFSSAKIDKDTGEVVWIANYKINEQQVNGEGPQFGNQAAMAIGIDCLGDVYLTGYYGNSNYGPGITGVMKLNGDTGDKIYDFTFTNNLGIHDDGSIGRDVFVQDDTLRIVSKLQTDIVTFAYVGAFDPANGAEYYRNQFELVGNSCGSLEGLLLQNSEIVHGAKLVGNEFTIEDILGETEGDVFSDSHIIIEEDPLFDIFLDRKIISLTGQELSSIRPLYMYNNFEEFDQFTVDTILLLANDGELQEVDLWAAHNVMVTRQGTSHTLHAKRDGEALISIEMPDDEGATLFESKIDRLAFSSNVYAGTNAIVRYNPSTLGVDATIPYASSTYVYGNVRNGADLFLCGRSENNQPKLVRSNMLDEEIIWEVILPFEGRANYVTYDGTSEALYITGVIDGKMFVCSLDEFTGEIKWLYDTNDFDLDQTIPLDMAISTEKNSIAIAAKQYKVDGSSDGILLTFNLQGDLLRTDRYEDEIGLQSEISEVETLVEGTFLFGGTHNTLLEGKRGFIAELDIDATTLDLGISGVVYYDSNQNKVQDNNEFGIPNVMMKIEPSNSQRITGESGFYFFLGQQDQSYSIATELEDHWSLTTDSVSYTVIYEASNPNIYDNDFGYYKELDPSAIINLTSNPTRCNTDVNFHLKVLNDGLLIENGRIELSIDSRTDIIEVVPAPDDIDIETGNLIWLFDTLYPFESIHLDLILMMPNEQMTGENLSYAAQIAVGDNQDLLNVAEYNPIVLCSYDPNDKLVMPQGIDESQYTLFGDSTLNYTVRFQNTGNAPAIDVRILDTLDIDFDLSTFRVINSSFPVRTSLVGNAVEFLFKDINLVDSVSNESESHGFVNYQIKLKNGVNDYTIVENTAHIIFDFNPAIVTNTTLNTMVEMLPVSTNEVDIDDYVAISPNPTDGVVNIQYFIGSSGIDRHLVRDALGQYLFESSQSNIDLTAYPDGVYFIEFIFEGELFSKRLIKQ